MAPPYGSSCFASAGSAPLGPLYRGQTVSDTALFARATSRNFSQPSFSSLLRARFLPARASATSAFFNFASCPGRNRPPLVRPPHPHRHSGSLIFVFVFMLPLKYCRQFPLLDQAACFRGIVLRPDISCRTTTTPPSQVRAAVSSTTAQGLSLRRPHKKLFRLRRAADREGFGGYRGSF